MCEECWDDYCECEPTLGALLRSWKSKLRRKLSRRRPKPINGAQISYVVMDEAVHMLDADVSQFRTMLEKVSSVRPPGSGMRIQWLEDDFLASITTAGDFFGEHVEWRWDDSPRKPITTITMPHADWLTYGTILRNERSGQSYRVLARRGRETVVELG